MWDALPIDGSVNTWGDEIYFGIPVDVEPEPDADPQVEVGDLAYSPVGPFFCILFGRTPASIDDKPRAARPVNRIGRLAGDPTAFRAVADGTRVAVERLSEV